MLEIPVFTAFNIVASPPIGQFLKIVTLDLHRAYIELDLPLLIESMFAAAAAMISFGAVLGKVSPTQITSLVVLQAPIYAFNAYLVNEACSNPPTWPPPSLEEQNSTC